MYERKGKLYKKSLNSEVFKERWFVLERDHLFYFKSEKNSKFINCHNGGNFKCRGQEF